MENRRYAVAPASKPYRKNTYNDQDGSKYGNRPYKSKYSRESDDRYGKRKPRRGYGGGRAENRNPRFQPKNKSFRPRQKEDLPKIVSEKQITDGKFRGKYLHIPDSEKGRPTARRIREVMFRIIFRRVRAGRFLDLCAGAGTVGLEAVSRGSLLSTFVERSSRMCSIIRKNMEELGVKEGHGEIVELEVIPFLKKMEKRRRYWDVVYFDPPYGSRYDEVLDYFARGVSIKMGGVLIIEHPREMFFPEKIGVMRRWKVVVEGNVALSFFDRRF